MFEDPFNVSPIVSQTALRRRLAAFVVTSLAVFISICLIWPFSVENFRSVSGVNLGAHDLVKTSDQLKPLLAYAIREEFKDGRLESALRDTEARTELKSKPIEIRDYEAISNSIQMGVVDTSKGYQLQIVYDGEGTSDERELLNVLAERVAYRISTGRATGKWDGPELEIDSSLVVNDPDTETSSEFEKADFILEQLENDLNQVATMLGNRSSLELESENESAFSLASTKRVVDPGDGVSPSDVKRTVESIDVSALRGILHNIRSKHTPSGKPREPLQVLSVNNSKSAPIGGAPGLGSFLLLGSLAGLIGSIVAWHFDPFEHRGFEDVHSVSKTLGVPVVAISDTVSKPNVVREHGWANHAAKAASLFLLLVSLVVVGFLVLNTEVREAFFTNPFHGCARIVQCFTGR